MRCVRFLLVVALLAAPSAGWAHGTGSSKQVVQPKGRRQLAAEAAAAMWTCPMCETVRADAPGTCPHCGMDLVTREPDVPEAAAIFDPQTDAPAALEPASEAALDAGLSAPQRSALMPGLPDGLFYAMALSLLGLSFALFSLFDRGGPLTRGRRLNLFRVPWLGPILRSPIVFCSARVGVLSLFLLVIAAGLFGNQAPEHNLAPVLTWTIWWTWLVFAIVFFGKLWCTVYPWPTIAEAVAPKSLGLRWPKAFRNLWLATGLFVLLTWLELGYGVTGSPWLTAVLGLCMTVAVIASTAVFERRPFCRYACLVGRVSGLYSLFFHERTSRRRCGDVRLVRHEGLLSGKRARRAVSDPAVPQGHGCQHVLHALHGVCEDLPARQRRVERPSRRGGSPRAEKREGG